MYHLPMDRAIQDAGRRYPQTLANLREARLRYIDAHVPMEVADGGPERWTEEQATAVLRYANAWHWLFVEHELWTDALSRHAKPDEGGSGQLCRAACGLPVSRSACRHEVRIRRHRRS